MSLLDLLKTPSLELSQKSVQQIISFAGKGRLLDGSECSIEFREFLNHIDSKFLEQMADQSLEKSFAESGEALQDVVNELGRRLGFKVENGRYRGSQKDVGFDGLWVSDEGQSIIVEVKTSDVYQIKLDTIANYRKKLSDAAKINIESSSILIVVGRIDTNALEAQIRGSRHAWDIRLISVESLLKLLRIKEETDDPAVHTRISNILIPQEYTRLDGIVDLAFATVEDVQSLTNIEQENQESDNERASSSSKEMENRSKESPPANFHDNCIKKIADYLGESLVRESRAIFKTPDSDTWLSCAVSKAYDKNRDKTGFWYAFHPHQQAKLAKARKSYVAFGCGSDELIVMIPFHEFEKWLPGFLD